MTSHPSRPRRGRRRASGEARVTPRWAVRFYYHAATEEAFPDPSSDPIRTADVIRAFRRTVDHQQAGPDLRRVVERAVERGVPADGLLVYFGRKSKFPAEVLEDACVTLISRLINGQGLEVSREGFVLAAYLTPLPADWQTAVSPLIRPPVPEEIFHLLNRQNDAITAVHARLAEQLQRDLRGIEGETFGFEVNQRIAARIQETLDRVGWTLVCPQEGCGRPARLRCQRAGRSKSGFFQFDHVIDGRRTRHLGSSRFPPLLIRPAPEGGALRGILPQRAEMSSETVAAAQGKPVE